jgi:hypothetical protein
MRKLAHMFYRIQRFGKKSVANVRSVDTTRGRIRVLEYGFDSLEPAPLYIDLHGGGFVLMTADADEWKISYCARKRAFL